MCSLQLRTTTQSNRRPKSTKAKAGRQTKPIQSTTPSPIRDREEQQTLKRIEELLEILKKSLKSCKTTEKRNEDLFSKIKDIRGRHTKKFERSNYYEK